jgi:uncharacterized damage-inducible protein DinB
MKTIVLNILHRDLENIKKELQKDGVDKRLWVVLPGITNSTGNLILHICGNLRHFIGNILGKTGYHRERDKEFINKPVPAAALISLVNTTLAEVSAAIESLDETTLNDAYPIEIAGNSMKKGEAIIYLTSHLGYHLGQINYLDRILQNNHNG